MHHSPASETRDVLSDVSRYTETLSGLRSSLDQLRACRPSSLSARTAGESPPLPGQDPFDIAPQALNKAHSCFADSTEVRRRYSISTALHGRGAWSVQSIPLHTALRLALEERDGARTLLETEVKYSFLKCWHGRVRVMAAMCCTAKARENAGAAGTPPPPPPPRLPAS